MDRIPGKFSGKLTILEIVMIFGILNCKDFFSDFFAEFQIFKRYFPTFKRIVISVRES